MAGQGTPHTQTQQNASPAQADLEPNQLVQDAGQNDDAALYENMDGAQTGGTRAFNANAGRDNLPNAQQETAALNGRQDTRLPQGNMQGVTNHSVSEESARNQKVVNERADAQQGVDQTGNNAR